MSKQSILIFDTPECCYECPKKSYELYEDQISGRYLTHQMVCKNGPSIREIENGFSSRPSWCPLRQMPDYVPEINPEDYTDKNGLTHADYDFANAFRQGYNECLSDIYGDWESVE